MLNRLRRSAGVDAGFTLPELLITIVILASIIVPLGNLVIGYFQNVGVTTIRFNESHDAQLSAGYFAQDIASLGVRTSASPVATLAQSIETSVAYNAGLYPCGAAGTPTAIVRVAWNQYAAAPAATSTLITVSYVEKTVGTQTQLHRITCSNGSGVVDSVIAHELDPATPPSVTCYSTGTTVTPCSGSGAALPNAVRLTLAVKDPGDAGASYAVTLTGQRRQS